MTARPHASIQENVLTLLVHSDQQGGHIARLVDHTLFEGEYLPIAERALAYWRQYGEAPKAHMPDLLQDVLNDKKSRRGNIVAGIIVAMEQLAPQIQPGYVIDQLGKFLRLQKVKLLIHESAEKLSLKHELALEDVELMWAEMLRTREMGYSPGMRLDDIGPMLEQLETLTEFDLGIPALDDGGIVPVRQTLLTYSGQPSSGKSWFGIHCMKRALVRRRKVLYITLEMPERQLLRRMHQALWAIPKREMASVTVTRLVFETGGRLKGLREEDIKPEFSLASSDIEHELEVHLRSLGVRAHDNLIIKGFPQNSLTFDALCVFLDNLASVDKFIPDLLIIDMPLIMALPINEFRLSLGRLYGNIRGMLVERNMAGVVLHQINGRAKGRFFTRRDISEDISIVNTSDIHLTFTATIPEKNMGLGRLFVDKGRDDKDAFGVLITQNYDTGQYCLQSTRLPKDYFEQLQPKNRSVDEDDKGGD